MRKRILSLMLALMLLGSLSLSVSALEVPDLNRLGSISMSMTHDGRPVPGGSLTIYRVAEILWDGGNYVYRYTEEFASCTLPLTDLESAELAQELDRIARTGRIPGTTQQLNRQGKTRFTGLQTGLYLVVQKEAAPGYFRINPYLVSLPQLEEETYLYDVDTAPKNQPEPEVKPTEPTEPEPTKPPKPDDGKLPQTGQTNWPVPVMAIAGILLLMTGFVLRTSGKRKQDEA